MALTPWQSDIVKEKARVDNEIEKLNEIIENKDIVLASKNALVAHSAQLATRIATFGAGPYEPWQDEIIHRKNIVDQQTNMIQELIDNKTEVLASLVQMRIHSAKLQERIDTFE